MLFDNVTFPKRKARRPPLSAAPIYVRYVLYIQRQRGPSRLRYYVTAAESRPLHLSGNSSHVIAI